jgi:predicted RNA binding protein YcfA (HicA-like mRNA interferase family)
MAKLIVIPSKDFIKFLKFLGFDVVRIKGSHHRLRHDDGRVTTVPVHSNEDLSKGLLRKIIREDLQMELEEFNAEFDKWQND